MPSSELTSKIAIWERVFHSNRGDLHPEVARFFMNLAFDTQDLKQMHDLALRNQAGTLTLEESNALANYQQIGLQIDLLRSKARLSIQKLSS